LSRRSSKSRLREEDLPENYAELAKRVYRMAEKEGWSKKKVFELLKDPAKLVKTMEHVRYIDIFSNFNLFVGVS
jgi:ribosome-binding protein aMBF1 (putative translation factor)